MKKLIGIIAIGAIAQTTSAFAAQCHETIYFDNYWSPEKNKADCIAKLGELNQHASDPDVVNAGGGTDGPLRQEDTTSLGHTVGDPYWVCKGESFWFNAYVDVVYKGSMGSIGTANVKTACQVLKDKVQALPANDERGAANPPGPPRPREIPAVGVAPENPGQGDGQSGGPVNSAQ